MTLPPVAVASAPTYDAAIVERALQGLAEALGWADVTGPFGQVIRSGDTVTIKPNWVLERNKADEEGLLPLVTHGAVVLAVIDAVLRSPAGRIVVGDAPLQGCDFAELMRLTGLDRALAERAARDARLEAPRDFRGTRARLVGGVILANDDEDARARGVEVQLGRDSWLEPVSDKAARLRVTQYPPDGLRRTHAPGNHRYLVAPEVLAADVLINVPKLKTHRKAGVTSALKNLVGINVDKSYLPHHTTGGPAAGGDCYPDDSPALRLQEWMLDQWNASRAPLARFAWSVPARALTLLNRSLNTPLGVEGAWIGNDTVWRTVLDLNHIAAYADRAGNVRRARQRRQLHVVDAIVAGDGDGPLASSSHQLGVLLGGESAGALDQIGARLLGYDPVRVAVVREGWRSVAGLGYERTMPPIVGPLGEDAVLSLPPALRFPLGWVDAVDKTRVPSPVGIVRERTYSLERRADAE